MRIVTAHHFFKKRISRCETLLQLGRKSWNNFWDFDLIVSEWSEHIALIMNEWLLKGCLSAAFVDTRSSFNVYIVGLLHWVCFGSNWSCDLGCSHRIHHSVCSMFTDVFLSAVFFSLDKCFYVDNATCVVFFLSTGTFNLANLVCLPNNAVCNCFLH